VVVRAEISGVRGQDLRVNVDGEHLRISGIRRVPQTGDVDRLHQMEISFGPFDREIRISVPFDRDGVAARLEDGLLEVRLPKKKRVKRRIEVDKG